MLDSLELFCQTGLPSFSPPRLRMLERRRNSLPRRATSRLLQESGALSDSLCVLQWGDEWRHKDHLTPKSASNSLRSKFVALDLPSQDRIWRNRLKDGHASVPAARDVSRPEESALRQDGDCSSCLSTKPLLGDAQRFGSTVQQSSGSFLLRFRIHARCEHSAGSSG
jgi:hypothetical protein